MFAQVPAADAYSLKLILHDWDDQECVAILANIRAAATGPRRVFIMEHIVPGPREPHFAKLFDIHMLCWGTGRERTESEYAQLLDAAGFRHVRSWYPAGRSWGLSRGSPPSVRPIPAARAYKAAGPASPSPGGHRTLYEARSGSVSPRYCHYV